MDAPLKAKVTEIFSRYKFSNEDAAFISEVLNKLITGSTKLSMPIKNFF